MESPAERRALITGGAGFVGSHLAETLLADGWAVTVIDDLSTGRYENVAALDSSSDFHFVEQTVLDRPVIDRLTDGCDVVYHLAAAVGVELIVRDPVHTLEANILGTQAVLEAAQRYRRRFLLVSTSEIYGKSEETPFREDGDRLLGPTSRPRWSYSTSKAVDEYLALAYHHQKGLPVVVARLFNTIGPRQRGSYGMVVPRFVAQAVAGEPLTVYGDGRQQRCFCDVRDVVRALIGLMESEGATGETFNVGSDQEISILELARLTLRLAGRDDSADTLRLVPYEEAYGPRFEDMRRRLPALDKIRGLLGWTAEVPLPNTLRDLIEAAGSREGRASSC